MAKNTTVKKAKRKAVGMILAENLHAWRAAQGLTLAKVAKDLKVSISVISQWERGLRFPSARNLDNVSKHLGITVSQMLDEGCCR